jgi:ankyrin repeat protein
MAKLFFSNLFKKKNLWEFCTAILTNNTNKICRILDVNRDYIHRGIDNTGNTALLLAIQHASPLTVRILLEQGAHPDQSNFLTLQTPLTLLAETNQSHQAKFYLEMANILLDHGVSIDKTSPYLFTDENGKEYTTHETPLMTAVRTRNIPTATLFLEKKANVNYTENQSKNRP